MSKCLVGGGASNASPLAWLGMIKLVILLFSLLKKKILFSKIKNTNIIVKNKAGNDFKTESN